MVDILSVHFHFFHALSKFQQNIDVIHVLKEVFKWNIIIWLCYMHVSWSKNEI